MIQNFKIKIPKTGTYTFLGHQISLNEGDIIEGKNGIIWINGQLYQPNKEN